MGWLIIEWDGLGWTSIRRGFNVVLPAGWPRLIRSKIGLLESVTSQSTQSLKRYGYFSDLGVEIALSHRHVEKRFSGKMNTAIHDPDRHD